MECTLPEWKNILDLQAEIQNLKKRTSWRYHNGNEYKPKKTQGRYYRENPTWIKKNKNPEENEPKIRTWNDTAWNWYSKEKGGKCIWDWRVNKPSECRVTSTNNHARGYKGISIHKRIQVEKAMEILIQSSDDSDRDGYNGWPTIHKTRIRHLQRQIPKREHRSSLKLILLWMKRIGKIRRVNLKKVK